MNDLIDTLEHMAAEANWDHSVVSNAEDLLDAKASAAWALTYDGAMLRALEGERMHGVISPAVEVEDADEGAPSEDDSPKSEAPRAS